MRWFERLQVFESGSRAFPTVTNWSKSTVLPQGQTKLGMKESWAKLGQPVDVSSIYLGQGVGMSRPCWYGFARALWRRSGDNLLPYALHYGISIRGNGGREYGEICFVEAEQNSIRFAGSTESIDVRCDGASLARIQHLRPIPLIRWGDARARLENVSEDIEINVPRSFTGADVPIAELSFGGAAVMSVLYCPTAKCRRSLGVPIPEPSLELAELKALHKKVRLSPLAPVARRVCCNPFSSRTPIETLFKLRGVSMASPLLPVQPIASSGLISDLQMLAIALWTASLNHERV